jgi:hypothetical protein
MRYTTLEEAHPATTQSQMYRAFRAAFKAAGKQGIFPAFTPDSLRSVVLSQRTRHSFYGD